MIVSSQQWALYHYVTSRGKGVLEDWAVAIGYDGDLLARLNQKLDLLQKHGSDLPPGLLAGTPFRHVDKLRIFGSRQTWRVMVCKGPIENEAEFTILYAARERDRKLIPLDAYERADNNRKTIIEDSTRRRLYERISRKPKG